MMINEAAESRRIPRIDKWLALGLMERIEQVRTIAMMLETTMEDINDRLDDVKYAMEELEDETESIDEHIEKLMGTIESLIDDSPVSAQQSEGVYASDDEELPF